MLSTRGAHQRLHAQGFYWKLVTNAASAWHVPYVQTPRRKAGVPIVMAIFLGVQPTGPPCRFLTCQPFHNHVSKFLKISLSIYLYLYVCIYVSIYTVTGKKARGMLQLVYGFKCNKSVPPALWTPEIPFPPSL